MKKRIIMIMIATVMTFGMVACGNSPEEKGRVSRTSSEEDNDEDDDDEEDDDKDKKGKKDKDKKDKDTKDKDKKGKDKKDKSDKDDKKDKNDKSGKKEDDDVSDSDEYWVIDDDAFGSDFTVDEEYVSYNYYNPDTREIQLCDYDGNKIMKLHVPDGFVVTFASDKGACFDLNNENQYFDSLSIDYSDNVFLGDYLREGIIPDGDVKNYEVEVEEYKTNGVKYCIAHEYYYSEIFEEDEEFRYILIPYKINGTKDYVTIHIPWNRTDEELVKIAEELIGE